MKAARYNPFDFDKDISIGIKLPYSKTYSTYTPTDMDYISGSLIAKETSLSLFDKTYTTSEQTKYNLINLILTKKGERIMHPNFGTNIYKYLFDPIDITLKTKLKDDLLKDIKLWMPYLIIDGIDVILENENIDRNELKLAIKFKLYDSDDAQELNLNFGNTITYN